MAPLSLPPGFRFHPTDEELIICYLKRKINSRTIDLEIIPEVDLYKCEPWELPSKSLLPSKDLEWYFFSPRDRKYPNGSRTNRATKMGYWKATGKDRRVNSSTKAAIGTKKTLVYYRGRAPHGMRTGWIMHEYRLDQSECEPAATSLQDAYALCRVFKKETITSNSASSSKTQYNFPNTSHKPSSERSIYSEGRSSRYHDFGTLAYSIPVQRCSPSNISPQMAPRSSYNQQGPTDKQWMQCFADEDDFRFATPSFQNYGSTSYHPSKVEIPLGCARMQHQFTMPPLEVDASSQFDHPSNFTMPPSCFFNGRSNNDLLEDILSGHQTSEAFTNQNDMNSNYMLSPAESSLFTNTTNPWENLSSRSIEIGGKNQITSDMMVDYSNHSALPEENLEKIFARDYDDLIPVENFSDFHNQNEAQGEGGDHMINNSSKTNTFPPEFGSHDNPNRRFVDDAGDLEKFFDDFEEVEVSHSLLCVSTKGLTETYFHRVEPSRTVRVHQHKRQEMQQGVELITSEKESPSHHKTKYWKGFNTLISRFMGLPNTRSAEEETGSGLIRKMKARKGKKGVAWLVRESEGLMANFVAKTMWTPVTVILALFSIWANVGGLNS